MAARFTGPGCAKTKPSWAATRSRRRSDIKTERKSPTHSFSHFRDAQLASPELIDLYTERPENRSRLRGTASNVRKNIRLFATQPGSMAVGAARSKIETVASQADQAPVAALCEDCFGSGNTRARPASRTQSHSYLKTRFSEEPESQTPTRSLTEPWDWLDWRGNPVPRLHIDRSRSNAVISTATTSNLRSCQLRTIDKGLGG